MSHNEMINNPAMQTVAISFMDGLASLSGYGNLGQRIADLMDDFLGLVAQADINGQDLDGSITTISALYMNAKKVDEAYNSLNAK